MSYSVYLPNYSIGENCYKELPYVARNYGKKAVVIGGKTAMEKAKDALPEGRDPILRSRISSGTAVIPATRTAMH
mgnify:CR=1 FL=1